MNNKERHYFFALNYRLVKIIQEALSQGSERSEAVQVWVEIKKDLRKLIEACEKESNQGFGIKNLASIQVALGKYLDFYSTLWMKQELKKELDSYVETIVKFSLLFAASGRGVAVSSCGLHEDGACLHDVLGKRFQRTVSFDGYTLPIRESSTFLSKPIEIVLQPGEHLYRVVGRRNNKNGAFWFRRKGEISKLGLKKWRSGWAVLQRWNKNKYYVDFKVKKKLKVLVGPAASQRVILPDGRIERCILEGGEEQIWLSTKNWPVDLSLKETKWKK